MSGMSANSGRATEDEVEHIRQSIKTILTTPVGSRVKRREFGSLLPILIDHPANPANRLRLVAATYMAVIRWEPRVHIDNAIVAINADGRVVIDLEARRRNGPRSRQSINLSIPIR